MSALQINFDKFLEGGTAVALARVISADGSDRELPLVIGSGSVGSTIDVAPGPWRVQVTLPSGRVVTREGTAGREETITVDLPVEHSAHEWLSWTHLATGIGAAGTTLTLNNFVSLDDLRRIVAERKIQLRVGDDVHRIHDSGTVSAGGVQFTVVIEADAPYLAIRIEAESSREPQQWPRVFLSARANHLHGVDLSLPIPWYSTRTFVPARVTVVLIDETAYTLVSDTSPPVASVVIEDPVFASVFGYLGGGDPSRAARAARTLTEEARRMLLDKMRNPYAAAGAGYVLLDSMQRGAEAEWGGWLSNLDDWFGWLPDGAILHGAYALRRGRRDEGRAALLRGFARGTPVFTTGLRLLSSSLRAIYHSDDVDVSEALSATNRQAATVDPELPFLTTNGPSTTRGSGATATAGV